MPETIDLAFAPGRAAAVAGVDLDGEIVLYDDRNGRVHALNASASVVWRLLDGATSIGAIIDAIATASGRDATAVVHDVVPLIRMFAELGILAGIDAAAIEPPSP